MAELVPIAAGAVPEPLVEKYAYPATATAATVVESAVRRNAFLYKSFSNVRYLRSQEGGLLRRGSRPTVDRPGGPVRHHPSGWTEVHPSAVGSGRGGSPTTSLSTSRPPSGRRKVSPGGGR